MPEESCRAERVGLILLQGATQTTGSPNYRYHVRGIGSSIR